MYPGWEVSGGLDRQEFPELSPGHTTSGSNGTASSPHWSTAYHWGSRTCLPHQAWWRQYPCHSQFGHWWADVVWVFDRSLTIATAHLVDPQHTLSAHDGVSADTTTADGTRALVRFLEDIMANTRHQALGLIHVDMEPFTFYASLPRLELGDTLLLAVHNEHQVISVEKLPRYTSAKLTRKRLHHQNEEQWTKERNTNSHAEILTVLNIDLHMTIGIRVHALDDTHSPFHDPEVLKGPPKDLP